MSLIQDALKRQQEEMNKKPNDPAPENPLAKLQTPLPQMAEPQAKIPLRMMGQPSGPPKTSIPPGLPASIPLPPPVPAAPTPPTETVSSRETPAYTKTTEAPVEKKAIPNNDPPAEKKSIQPVLLIVLALLVVFGTGFFFAHPYLSILITPQGGTVGAQPTGTPVVVSVEPTGTIDEPSTRVEATVSPPAEVAAIQPPEPIAVLEQQPEPAPAVPAVAELITSDPTPEPTPEPPPEPAIWPAIKMTGMVKLGSTAAALINGRVVAAGETIEDVLLINVTKDGALLRYEGEERTLRVGETAR